MIFFRIHILFYFVNNHRQCFSIYKFNKRIHLPIYINVLT